MNLLTRTTVLLLALLLGGSPATATSISFLGNYTLEDDDLDGFSERLSFDNPFGAGSGAITAFDPTHDALFMDGANEYVAISVLTLDPANPFYFDPTLYVDGFSIFDDDGHELLVADLTVTNLEVTGNSGSINTAMTVNLSDVTAGAGYAGGGSIIVDEFLALGGGITLTLQFPGQDLGAAIESGQTLLATYSGSAAVPEPALALFLLGGAAGLCLRRRV